MKMIMFYILFFSTGLVLGNELRITNESEFSSFVNEVNTGNDYSGFTVYLDSDFSLPEINDPIGFNSTYQFSGIFDGQGHIISNLNINSSLSYVGLFGHSEGLTIRNVVLDSSCSIINTYKESSNSLVGGIIGRCYSNKGQCVIENTVNMGSVTFNGNTSNTLYLGGITGYLYSPSYSSFVRNCVNYGEVIHSGTSGYSYIGGIVGYFSGSYFYCNYIQNCLNYGTITYNSTSSYSLYLGGIIGHASYTHIENCVSAGKINTASSRVIGSIVGYVVYNTTINNCYFTDELSNYNISGTGSPQITPNTPNNYTDVNLTLINNLNNYSLNNGYNKWLLNINNNTVSFVINNIAEKLTVNSQIILLFNIIDDERERNFSGWYNDENLTSPFNLSEVKKDTILYGMLCYSNYTVTLDVNDGNESSLLSIHPMIIECNGIYGTLPTPARKGYMFTGWFTEKENGKGEKIESGNKVVKLSDHVLYAHWEKVTVFVEITFDTKDLTEDEIKNIVKQYTNDTFKIVKINNTSDEIKVIIKFTDIEKAVNFVEIIKGSSDALTKDHIKKVNFITEDIASFSYPILFPFLLFILMI